MIHVFSLMFQFQPTPMKHILITGASGFIGSHAVDCALAAGFRVTAVARSLPQELPQGVDYRRADLFERGQARDLIISVRPTHLLHTAWVVTPSECWSSRDNHRWVDASREFIQTFAETGGQRVVVTGSCAEYDWRTQEPCDEKTTPTHSQTLYGRCKNELCEWAAEYSRKVGLSLGWARLFFLYGPREHPDRLFSAVIRSLLSAKSIACTAGNQLRDFLYVADAADALVALLQSDIAGTINIASGNSVTIRDAVEQIALALGRPELVQFGARPTPSFEPPLLVANIARLSNELRWQPRFSLPEGLNATIEWWRGQYGPAATKSDSGQEVLAINANEKSVNRMAS